MKYWLTSTRLTVIDNNGKNHNIQNDHRNFSKICKAVSDDDQEAFDNLLVETQEPKISFEDFEHELFEKKEDGVYYRGIWKLDEPFVQKLKTMVSLGFSLDPFIKFLDNLYNNVSNRVINQLVRFLDYKELPITEDGCFIAYKGVNRDKYSLHGNLQTELLQGVRNEAGQILNEEGHVIEVRRNHVDDDPTHHCSHGLHVGSYSYAKGFGSLLATVKVNPVDVVAVPEDYNGQKLRCCKYVVVKLEVEEIPIPVSDGVEGAVEEPSDEERVRKGLLQTAVGTPIDYISFANEIGVGTMVVLRTLLSWEGLEFDNAVLECDDDTFTLKEEGWYIDDSEDVEFDDEEDEW